MKPVTAETVGAEIERLVKCETLSMRETFYLNCLRNLMGAMSNDTTNGKRTPRRGPKVQS
ncbi:hypothetical protein [Pantoea sp. BAV 3049]|uniref:hypothetical protein n=1 Tax=Pantoea sp. BAV 3049 TaxID=2654188 RepID=UPI00131E2EDE|nr:hypothetical protein [Pantoea sp. BAV 3049]